MLNYINLSRAVSHALRHAPWLYELELDDEGWVPIEALLEALRGENSEWTGLTESALFQMVACSDKQRHEIKEGKIRALYGHSVPRKLAKEPAQPPTLLYHGTAPETAKIILCEGLHPMRRQYVHLSVDEATAAQVGHRKTKKPALLVVHAKQAYQQGANFYRGNDHVWLADAVPPQFIELSVK